MPHGGEVHSVEDSESSSKSGSEFTICMIFGQLLTLSEPLFSLGFLGGSVVKNLPANAGDTEDVGSNPVSGRSLEEEVETHPSIFSWKIQWTEEPR